VRNGGEIFLRQNFSFATRPFDIRGVSIIHVRPSFSRAWLRLAYAKRVVFISSNAMHGLVDLGMFGLTITRARARVRVRVRGCGLLGASGALGSP
jgi:hypothetical protein